MPLPQQVIEQLSREPSKTPGWSSGILFFSGSILAIVLVIYAGLAFAYEPYLNGEIQQVQEQLVKQGQKISSADQASLITYYSEITNLHGLVGGHVFFSHFLTWLATNTEANVYYGSLNFTSGNQVTLATFAKTQADVNQQIGIFESSSDVQGVSVSNISFSPTAQAWMFDVTLTLNPQMFLWSALDATAAPSPSAIQVAPITVATTTATIATTTTP